MISKLQSEVRPFGKKAVLVEAAGRNLRIELQVWVTWLGCICSEKGQDAVVTSCPSYQFLFFYSFLQFFHSKLLNSCLLRPGSLQSLTAVLP